MQKLRENLEKLAAQAKANNIHRMAEMQVQSDYVLKVLEALGWKSSDWALGTNIGANTGTFSDILLHDSKKHPVLVVECKDAKKADKLDGCYRKQTFQEQLYGYCRKQGINWGILTNFVEWRLYNDVQERLYQNKKYAFMDLLWPGANPNTYVDILSDEGLAFLMKFQRTPLCQAKGKVDDDPLYYPIEKRIEDTKAKFFFKLKGWRDSLRRELHRSYGEKYEKDQIDLFTQKILDRMIFIEVCHDKDIIGQNVHRAILNSRVDKYHELKKWFKEMDEQFNTELFTPMAIDNFDIDDKVLVPIITELNEIDFSEISVHIIGEVYENYLGEMLRVTKKSGLKAQEHKEHAKRKSQGIYYTPEYIVEYIVKNTVGELVNKAKTEDELKKIKILDPACGSGSFLIKAFDVLYDAYENLKIEKNRGQLETGKDLKIKRQILQHNLYGVDLDDRAVEITKLNLMLKALEGFNYSELKGRKLLPNLNLNIRVGNSLISGQTIEQLAEKQAQITIPGLDDTININPLLKLHNAFYKEVEDEEKARLIKEIEVEERRLNRKLGDNIKGYFGNLDEVKPLNYQVAFPEVYKQGGFDAVIGNPPYTLIGSDRKDEQRYFNNGCYRLNAYKINTYILFLEKGLNLLNGKSLLGYIVPKSLAFNTYFINTRGILLKEYDIKRIVEIKDKVFENAEVGDSILFFGSKKDNNIDNVLDYIIVKNIYPKIEHITKYSEKQSILSDDTEKRFYKYTTARYAKTKNLGDVANISNGLNPGNVRHILFSNKKESKNHQKLLLGRDIQRYSIKWSGTWVNYDPSIKNNIKLSDIKSKEGMTPQKKIDFALRNPAIYIKGKIMVRKTADHIVANIDDIGYYYDSLSYGVLLKPDSVMSIYYVLGLLNSKYLNKIHNELSMNKDKVFAKVLIANLAKLPIRVIETKKDKILHNQIVRLVKEMLKLNKTEVLRQRNYADITVIDKEIDELVYRLYGLSHEEIKAA